MSLLEKARRVFEIELAETKAVAERLDESFVKAIELFLATIERGSKIIVLGVGKSGHVGDKIAATMTSTGSPAVVLNSLNALHGDLGVVSDGDVVLALSYSGETEELLRILPALKRFDVRIVSITGKQRSTLAMASDVVLDVKVSQEACPMQLAPTSSSTAMLVLGDALAMVLLEERGFTKEQFAKLHPGGSLGRALLLRVSEIMRDASITPLLTEATTVLEAVQAMTQRKTGAAVVLKPDGTLAGIFTHGDFARHFPNHPDIGSRRVSEFMTAKPVSIRSNHLAAEVLQVLEHHRVDDLVVLDESDRPIGLVDSQDLTRLKIL
ncbi:MAG TPA: KpsF/GutQ family sugar-phosphate isomerase [Chthoniobacterales bacterium]